MGTEDFQPQVGDLYIPDDMQQMFGGGKPVYQNKSMVLIGTMGSGKTTLYNKLTNSTEKTSNGAQTCTRRNVSKKGLNIELQITDTPGLALDGGASVDDSLEVRNALTVGDVTQIVVVQSLPNNSRVSALQTSLAPIDNVMGCATFCVDADGFDTCLSTQEWKSHRTRVFLVLTHRDNFQGPPRSEWKEYIKSIRDRFSWVGPVALIDRTVSQTWLYETLVVFAGFAPQCCTDYHIPEPEFLYRFNIEHNLTDEQKDLMFLDRHDLLRRIQAALAFTEGMKQDENAPAVTGVLNFLEDSYHDISSRAFAKLCTTSTKEFLEEKGKLEEQKNFMYRVKAFFARPFLDAKIAIQSQFPGHGNDAALYKKCPQCSTIYSRPRWIDFEMECFSTSGRRNSMYTMDFDERQNVLALKKMQDAMAVDSQPSGSCKDQKTGRFSDVLEQIEGERLCNFRLVWNTMLCATRSDLIDAGIASVGENNGTLRDGTDSIPDLPAWLPGVSLEQDKKDLNKAGIQEEMSRNSTEHQLREVEVPNKFHSNKMLGQLPGKRVQSPPATNDSEVSPSCYCSVQFSCLVTASVKAARPISRVRRRIRESHERGIPRAGSPPKMR